MKVDRTRFLFLTAAIAGAAALTNSAGCTINDTNVAGDGGTQGDATAGGDSATIDGASGDDSSADVATGDDASAIDSSSDTATCNDNTGTAPDCAAAADAGAGCGMNAYFQAACPTWATNLKPVVANAAVNCAIALPTCESGAGLEACLTNALNASCADTTALPICMGIATECGDAGLDPGITQAQCDTYVSGLNDTGRTSLEACFNTGMCATQFADCISNALLPAPP